MGYLYKLTSPSGKSYIGITSKGVEKRWAQHRFNAAKEIKSRAATECNALYNAIRKYGAASFIIELLDQDDSWESLCNKEIEAIASHGSFWPNGYNMTLGGEGTLGVKITKETRIRLSAAQKRILKNPKAAMVRAASLQKAQLAAADFHRNMTDEQRAVHGNSIRRAYENPDARNRLREAQSRIWSDPEKRRRQGEALRGRKMPAWTAERKAQAAAKRRSEWADSNMRAKRLAGYAKYQESRR